MIVGRHPPVRPLGLATGATVPAAAGVARATVPAVGQPTPERSRPDERRRFRRGFRSRAGIGGRVSAPRRCRGLACCRDRGEDGIGRGIAAGNLWRVARTGAARQRARAARSRSGPRAATPPQNATRRSPAQLAPVTGASTAPVVVRSARIVYL